MNRFSIEILFVLSMSILSTLLFFNVIIYKTEFYGIDKNPVYNSIQWIMIGCLIVFNYSVLKYEFWFNLLLTLLISILSDSITNEIYSEFSKIFPQISKRVMPFGWQYKWFELLVFSFIIVILTELTYLLKRKYFEMENNGL